MNIHPKVSAVYSFHKWQTNVQLCNTEIEVNSPGWAKLLKMSWVTSCVGNVKILGIDGKIHFLTEDASKYTEQCKQDSEVFLFSVQKGIGKT